MATKSTTPLRICNWNIENFPHDPRKREPSTHIAERVGAYIANALESPHILAAQEIMGDTQTDPQSKSTHPVSAQDNAELLIHYIEQAGGNEHYRYCDVPPANGSGGGIPGGNIRNGFFYRDDRVKLVKIEAITEPAEAFEGARKPLIAEFEDKKTGEHYIVANVHFQHHNRGTKRETSAYGSIEQENQARGEKRTQQAIATAAAVQEHMQANPDAHAMVCGDFNTSDDYLLKQFRDVGLHCASDSLSEHSRIYEGVPEKIDHVFVSDSLKDRVALTRPVIEQKSLIEADKVYRPISDHNPTITSVAPLKREISAEPAPPPLP